MRASTTVIVVRFSGFFIGGGLFSVPRFATFLLFFSAVSLLNALWALSLFMGAHLMFLHWKGDY